MSGIVERFEGLEERLALVEAALALRLPGALREVRERRDATARGVELLTLGGVVTVSMLGGAPGLAFGVPGGEGVSVVVYRKCRGGDVQSTELEPHEFESVVDALSFLDLVQDSKVVFVGADAGEDVEIELAQVADVTFTPADAVEVAA